MLKCKAYERCFSFRFVFDLQPEVTVMDTNASIGVKEICDNHEIGNVSTGVAERIKRFELALSLDDCLFVPSGFAATELRPALRPVPC